MNYSLATCLLHWVYLLDILEMFLVVVETERSYMLLTSFFELRAESVVKILKRSQNEA